MKEHIYFDGPDEWEIEVNVGDTQFQVEEIKEIKPQTITSFEGLTNNGKQISGEIVGFQFTFMGVMPMLICDVITDELRKVTISYSDDAAVANAQMLLQKIETKEDE